ncbi:MAG: hypothetical protein JO089_03065, partial [Alphaproteobacteria bacterium]|nr:hypothetical protein [Alphaproteobacteria bacterium]
SDQIKSGLLSANDHIAQDAGKDIVKNTVNTITSDPIQGTQAFTQMLTQLGDVAKHQQDAAAYINSMSPGGTAAYGAAAGAAVLGTAGAIAGAAKDGVVGFFTNRLVEERKVASLNADQLPPPS